MKYYLVLSVFLASLFSLTNAYSQIKDICELPEEIVLYANDIEDLTIFTVTPQMFDEQISSEKVSPVCIKDTTIIKNIIQFLCLKATKCKNPAIDVRGLIVLKYDNVQEIKIYYNMSYILFNKTIFQIPLSLSYYLDSIRVEWGGEQTSVSTKEY